MKYIIFHHNDLDGYMGGAVIFHSLCKKGLATKETAKCYTCKFPTTEDQFHLDEIDKETIVYVVDYSFTNATSKLFEKICKLANKVVWLDHHQSSYESDIIDMGITNATIILTNNTRSGAWMAWAYVYQNILNMKMPTNPDEQIYVPLAIELTDDYDRWIHQYAKSKYFNDGMYLEENFRRPWDRLYYNLIFGKNQQNLLKLIIDNGAIIHKYNESRYVGKMQSIAYTRNIKIGWKTFDAIICNSDGNSMVFGDELNNHDIGIVWQYNGKQQVYFCSIFSTKEDINCAEIAMQMGGGGHAKAAGFSSPTNIFA